MRDHSRHIQVTREQAIVAILGACATPGLFERRTEVLPVAESFGRVLAEDAVAQLDMPNALTCAMDSIAVHWSDFADLDLEAGELPDTSAWIRGVDWQFANTGVGMPEGFDTAIVVEHIEVSEDEQHVGLLAAPSAQFAGTRAQGSSFRAGDVLAQAGTVVTPLVAAHIASGNNTQVCVVARPRVAFLPTGNELVAAGGEVPRGKNIETNSLLMKGKLEQWGAEPVLFPVTPDNPDAIADVLHRACAQADIVVLNAGSSKGSDDWSCEVLEEIGEVLYHQTNHGPGHHSFAALVDGTLVVGISGPPGGAAFTADFYVRPAVRAYLGLPPLLQTVPVRLSEDLGGGKPVMAAAKTAVVKPAAQKRPTGETRPREGGPFFRIRQMDVYIGEDGALEARPLPAGHPTPVQAEAARAYYAQLTGPDAVAPVAGDAIQLELRPEFGFGW